MIRFATVLKILNTEWDPIGLNGLEHFDPETDDEYYGYARDLVPMLQGDASASQISDYLKWAEGRMGVDVSLERIEKTTRRLVGERGVGRS